SFVVNDTSTTEIYTLSLHDALPIWTSQRLKASKAMTKGIKELGMAEDAAREQMPLRVISSGSDDYVSGPRFTDALPQGTNWVRYFHTDRPTSNPLLEILEPTTPAFRS